MNYFKSRLDRLLVSKLRAEKPLVVDNSLKILLYFLSPQHTRQNKARTATEEALIHNVNNEGLVEAEGGDVPSDILQAAIDETFNLSEAQLEYSELLTQIGPGEFLILSSQDDNTHLQVIMLQ